MNLQSRNRNLLKKRQPIWYAIIFCIALFLIFGFFPNFWLQVFYTVSTPFVSMRNFAASGFRSNDIVSEQNAELRQDIARLNASLLSMQAIQAQNESLSKMVGHLSTASPQKTVVASVLFGPPESLYDTLIINAGLKDGISVGNPVFADDGTPIGVITETETSFSKVSLYSSPGTSLPVVVGKDGLKENAIGEGGGEFAMKVPVSDAPNAGDAVYLPQFEPSALGAVAKVSSAPSDSFANVIFSLPVNIFTLSYVAVDTAASVHAYEASNN